MKGRKDGGKEGEKQREKRKGGETERETGKGGTDENEKKKLSPLGVRIVLQIVVYTEGRPDLDVIQVELAWTGKGLKQTWEIQI